MDPVSLLKEFLAIPSISTSVEHKLGIIEAQKFVENHLAQLGFKVEVIHLGGHPIVFAQRIVGKNLPHVALYAHYDVQPVDPLYLWDTPPFAPTIRNGRIYARGACDDKGPLVAQLVGVYRALKENPKLPVNITFLVEGEEEIGSPSFPKFLKKYGKRLGEADYLLISDGMSPSKEQVGVLMTLRGIATFHLEITGPSYDLHSGLYGGAIYNPAQVLAEILTSLHDDKGRVNIPGFYDDVVFPEAWQRKALKEESLNEKRIMQETVVDALWSMEGYTPKECTTVLPTIEINGMFGGYQGEGFKTIIPSKAGAKISCRLVKNQDYSKIEKLVIDTIKKRAPKGVKVSIRADHGGNPYRMLPPNKPGAPDPYPKKLAQGMEAVQQSIKKVTGKEPAYIHLGGSIPIIESIRREAGLDSIMFGLALTQDMPHAPNESFDLDILEMGSEIYKDVLLSVSR